METSISIVTPATSNALASLDDIKPWLVTANDSEDVLLQALIDENSGVIATACNRVFGRERLIETFSDILSNRVYLSHYPVTAADVISVTSNSLPITDYLLDEPSGKITLNSNLSYPVVVEYTGGYDLPTKVPMALKHAVLLLIRNDLVASGRLVNAGGVKQIAHKESRISYYQVAATATATSIDAVESLIRHYIRIWV